MVLTKTLPGGERRNDADPDFPVKTERRYRWFN